ncbi:hypothetical protein TNCV_714141 [Trichonephila clavipes]|nr:hypothetical protein TNCV_714141 [Trichonephila clavipes]
MDPHTRNLAQLATSLASTWLNIPVNNFRNLIESLPARLADIRSVEGTVKKRDYTAAQLVNMLKALAKARRQRQIRINGKGLRFGISK